LSTTYYYYYYYYEAHLPLEYHAGVATAALQYIGEGG